MEEKKLLREMYLKERYQLSEERIKELSRLITDKLMSLQEVKDARTILAYYSFRNEVDTIHLMNQLLTRGKKIYLPYTIIETRDLHITLITDLDRDLQEGNYGIMEPINKQKLSTKELDLVIIPALAYDRNGYRLGYGGGYYDRFLRRLPDRTITVGLTYSHFLLKEVPIEKHDLAVDIVITEEEVMYNRGDQDESF